MDDLDEVGISATEIRVGNKQRDILKKRGAKM